MTPPYAPVKRQFIDLLSSAETRIPLYPRKRQSAAAGTLRPGGSETRDFRQKGVEISVCLCYNDHHKRRVRISVIQRLPKP